MKLSTNLPRSQALAKCLSLSVLYLILDALPVHAGSYVETYQSQTGTIPSFQYTVIKNSGTPSTYAFGSQYPDTIWTNQTASSPATQGSIKSQGIIKNVFVWTHGSGQTDANDPPANVTVAKISQFQWYSYAPTKELLATGSSDGGLGFSEIKEPPTFVYNVNSYWRTSGISKGTLYETIQNPGASFTVSFQPSTTVTGTGLSSPADGNDATAHVSDHAGFIVYTQDPPVSITLTGTTPVGGVDTVLVGQQISASFNTTGTIKSGTKLAWKFNYGSNFKDYDPINKSNNDQLTNLSPVPDQDGNTDYNQSHFIFYTKKKETVQIQCSATLVGADGSDMPVTVTKNIVSVKPSVDVWGIAEGFVQKRTDYPGYSGVSLFGLFRDPMPTGPVYSHGMQWHDVKITDPNGFSGGIGSFTQIILPDVKHYQGNTVVNPIPNNGLIGLDTEFAYGSIWNITSKTGNDGDNPCLIAQGNPYNWTSYTANESFTTYVMYLPPVVGNMSTVYVPLQKYSWMWSEGLTWAANQWSIQSSSPATANSGPTFAPKDTSEFPQWNLVNNGSVQQ